MREEREGEGAGRPGDRVGPEHRRRLNEDGWCRVEGALPAATVDALRDALAGPAAPGTVRNAFGLLGNNLWRHLPPFAALVRDGWLASLVAELFDAPAVQWFQDNLVAKPPAAEGGGAFIPWHQDRSYWPAEGVVGLNVWVALDDADEASGCLWYAPGTHRLGEHRAASFGGPSGADRPDLPPVVLGDRPIVAAPARAGDLLCHHPFTWHASHPNTSERWRRGLATSWLLPGATWAPARANHPDLWVLRPALGSPVEGPWFPIFPRR